MSRNNSNENNVQGMSVTDCAMVSTPSQHDVASNILDNISQSSKRCCVECSTIVIVPLFQAPSEQTQVSTHYVTMNEVGSYLFMVQGTSSASFPTSFYYDRGVML
jgi:hypothetical protein